MIKLTQQSPPSYIFEEFDFNMYNMLNIVHIFNQYMNFFSFLTLYMRDFEIEARYTTTTSIIVTFSIVFFSNVEAIPLYSCLKYV